MRKYLFFITFCVFPLVVFSQEVDSLLIKKNFKTKDSIQIDSLSINPTEFNVLNAENQQTIASKYYRIDFAKSILFSKDSILNSSNSLYMISSFINQNLLTI